MKGGLSTWMTASGIPRHLAGKDLKALRSRMDLPKHGAKTAQGYIARAVDSLLDRGLESSVGQEYFDARDEWTRDKYKMV
jgi:hypothetical protein